MCGDLLPGDEPGRDHDAVVVGRGAVSLHEMRSGSLDDDAWAKLARRMSEVSEAPLFIDDSPNMTMMEIRAKAHRVDPAFK